MESFKVLNQQSFEMCFSDEVEGLYNLVITTKSGKEIKRAGRLSPAGATCFTQAKMEHGPTSYSDTETKFYADTLINDNIVSVSWAISRRYYEAPLSEGVFQMK